MPTLAIGISVRVVPIVGTLTANPVLAAAICVIATLGLAVLLSTRRAIGQTTLTGAWWWSLGALVGWAGTELADGLAVVSAGNVEPLRLAAISLSFCPVIAVLGAKRPQHAAWNFVVLSLWAIVTLPAAENFFLHPGQKLTLGDARAWFLWILILLGPINYVPTRFALASVLLAAGQIVALSPYLALIHRPLTGAPAVMGLMFVGSALCIAWLPTRQPSVGASANDRLWRDFQSHFGLLWSLRVQERMNALAVQNKWGSELTWDGFRPLGGGPGSKELDTAMEPAARTSFKGLLRRFVSSEWMDCRLSLRESPAEHKHCGAKAD